MKKLKKLLSSNAYANSVATLAIFLAFAAWMQARSQIKLSAANVMIIRHESHFDQPIMLAINDGNYELQVPIRIVLTNRSEKTQPLNNLDYSGGGSRRLIKHIRNKENKEILLPLNIPSNESRILAFNVYVPINNAAGEFLRSRIATKETADESEWAVTHAGDFLSFCIRMQHVSASDRDTQTYLIGLPDLETLSLNFAATADGLPYVIEEMLYVP